VMCCTLPSLTRRTAREVALAAVVLAGLLAAAVQAQPPEPPKPGGDQPGPRVTIRGQRMRVIRGADGKTVMETLDEKGNVLDRREMGAPPPPGMPFFGRGAAGREPGALAAAGKYVFVLLDGVLYQYDIDTLALKNKVTVAPNDAGPQIMQFVVPDPGAANRAWLGISIGPVDTEVARDLGVHAESGVLVTAIVEGGPADKAGVQQGDVIVKYNGKETKAAEDLLNAVHEADIGAEVEIELLRKDEKKTVKLRTGTMPGRGAPALGAPERTETHAEVKVETADQQQPRVTLDLQNADLRDTLRMLAQQTKANLTFGDDVQGRVTATLHDMALSQLWTPSSSRWGSLGGRQRKGCMWSRPGGSGSHHRQEARATRLPGPAILRTSPALSAAPYCQNAPLSGRHDRRVRRRAVRAGSAPTGPAPPSPRGSRSSSVAAFRRSNAHTASARTNRTHTRSRTLRILRKRQLSFRLTSGYIEPDCPSAKDHGECTVTPLGGSIANIGQEVHGPAAEVSRSPAGRAGPPSRPVCQPPKRSPHAPVPNPR